MQAFSEGVSTREARAHLFRFIDSQRGTTMSDEENEKYTRDRDEEFEGKAHPGEPLEPDELPESPPEFSKQQDKPREEPDVHPTSELSSTPKHKPGKPSSGTHPTAELHIKPKGRR